MTGPESIPSQPSVGQIYQRYKEFIEPSERHQGRHFAEILKAEFGLNSMTWVHLKAVYEHHLGGDAYATDLVSQIDEGVLTAEEARDLLYARRRKTPAIRLLRGQLARLTIGVRRRLRRRKASPGIR